MITPTSSERIFDLHRSSDKLPSPCSKKPNTSPTGHSYTTNPPLSTGMSSSSTPPHQSFTYLESSSLPLSAACRKVGSEPLLSLSLMGTTTSTPISPTLKRRSSYTRRSQKAMHRAAIRRIITVSNQQQQQQQQQQRQQQQEQLQQQHHQQKQPLSSSLTTCQSSSALQSPLCSPNLSRLRVVTQAVLKDHHPCLSARPFNNDGHHLQSPSSSSTKTTSSSHSRRVAVSDSCSCSGTPSSASSCSITYHSISSLSPLHTASSISTTNSSGHSSPFPSLPLPSSPSSCPNISRINNNNTTPFQLSTSPSLDNSLSHHSSLTRSGATTALGRQHASYRHNKPQIQNLIQQQQQQQNSGAIEPMSAPATDGPWRAWHNSLVNEEDTAVVRRHSVGESAWKKIIHPEETLVGRMRSGSTAAASGTTVKKMIFTPQKPPLRISTILPSVSIHVHQQSRSSRSARSLDGDLAYGRYPQKYECNGGHLCSSRAGDNGDASECYYSAVNDKNWIQDVDVPCHHSRWPPFGTIQYPNKETVAMDSTWLQHTIQSPYSWPRSQGRFRRHRIGNDISIQRRPSLRPLRHQLQQQQQHQKEQDQISHQPPRIQPETLQRRQLSLRYMRYLSTKPLPVLLRSISMSRKRSIGPTTTASSRHFGSNLLNKPLPPIPNATNPCIGGFPSNKECAYDLFAPQDGYHEARSTMVDPHHDQVHCFGGSKQELSSLLLQEGQGRPKEAIDSTMTGKHQHYGDYHLLTDRSESKEELIGTIALGIPSTMSKEDLLSGAQRDKAEINGDNSKQQTAEEKEEAGADTTLESRTKTTTDSTLSSSTNPSPTSVAALSLKRLESFRFPLRKSLIEKCSMASPRLHHHNHHHSLPHNTTIITYAHRLSKAANDANHLPLIASDLVRQSHPTRGPTSHTNTILTTVAATSTATTDRLGTEPGQDTIDANSASLPPTGAQEKESSTVRKHDSGWVSERHRRQIGQQRLLRWSESCSNISYHRTSLSFNSSKKALLSLQARRVNKPDAKVHLLPEILTITTIPTSGSSIPVLRGINSQSEDDEEGALSGLETVRITTTPIGVTEPVLRTTPNANTNIIATAGMASAAVDSPQDNTDYQLRVSGMDRVVVDTVLTELTAAQAFKSEAIGKSVMSSEGNGKSSAAVAYTDTSVHREGAVNEQGFNLSEAVGSRSTSGERVPPSSEADLTTVLDVFKIESGPMIDAGEIKRFVKRSHALQELESTEQSYVNDLDILYHVHLRVLETKSWFPQDVHANIRRCVISLLALHHSFLAQLQAYNTSETDREKRAPLNVYRTLELSFQALSRDHRLYSNFCELRMRTVNEINRTAGQATMAGLQKESKELIAQQGRPKSRTDLKDHLIKPIQRICRYPLLLKEILRLTSPNDPEYHFIDRAHECMKAMAQQMDETQRMVERKLLTEQFLKKLPETNFPRKSSITPLNPANSFSYSNSIGNHHHYYQGSASSGPHSLPSTSGVPPEELFEGGPFGEGILPSTLSKTYAGTLGSIVLAGALEYLIMPDMPIRLRYYGCFLFESMLIVVKAKKMSLYEPRQWLPLRLCELYETTRLDGYTRFGWRIVYDQFRIDFGASCEAERQAWMTALQTHIQAAKLAHARLPRDTAALETVVSSLPWNMARPLPPLSVSTLSSSASMGAISGSGSSRQVQVYHQPPSPTPSPWSTCSSAIPSPLMPPPPVVSSSTSSTMMMATSFMTNTNEPEKWNARVTPGVSLDAYAQYYDNNIHPHAYDTASADPHNPSRLALTRHLSVESRDNLLQGFGMAGNRTGTSTFTTGNIDYQDQCYSLLTQPHSQSRTRPTQDPNPHSTRRSESSASGGGGHLLLPSTPFPWLVPNPRPRSHSFDVTKVFASSHSGIKPNQRNLVQSMFKDVSTENIWTTTTAATANHPQPSPQPIPSVSSSSPMTLRAGRYSTSSPFSYFNHSSNSGGSGSLFSTSPKAIVATGGPNPVPSTTTAGGIVGGVAEDDETPVTMPTMQSAGSCSSLTNRFSRRRDSGTSAKSSPSCPTTVPSEKTERDRRRSSATAAFTATLTLNFRKNSDSSSHHLNSTNGNNWHEQRHRRRLSIPDSVTLLFNNNHANNHEPLGAATPPSTRDGIYQRISVKSQAQLIEKKATHGMTPSFASAPSLAPKHKSKKGLVPGKLKSSQSSQDLTSSFVVSSYSTSLTSTLKPDGDLGIGTSLATKTPASEAEADREILNSLSSAAAEAARSRRVASTDKVPRRSHRAGLTMTSLDDHSSYSLRTLTSTQSLPLNLRSNNSSTHSLVYSPAVDLPPRDTVEKIWMAVGRLTHKRSSGAPGVGIDRHSSSGSNKSHHSQPHQRQQQGFSHTSSHSSSSVVSLGNLQWDTQPLSFSPPSSPQRPPIQSHNEHDGAGVAESQVDGEAGSFDTHNSGKTGGPTRQLRRSSTHASYSSSTTDPNSSGSSPNTDTFAPSSSSGNRNHYRTVSESTVQSIDSATSMMSDGSIPHHHHGILGNMLSSSSSVPRLILTPSGSTRSRSSSNSSGHSNFLSMHEQPSSFVHMKNPLYHHRGKQQYDARQPPLQWPFLDELDASNDGQATGIAAGAGSPHPASRHSGTRKSMSSSSASSLSSNHHYQDSSHHQLQSSSLQDHISSSTKMATADSFQEGCSIPHTLHLGPSIQYRRKSLSILQNLTQVSQKFKTMIKSPTVGMRHRSAMSLSPVTMDHGSNNPVATTGHGGPAIDIVAGVVDEDEGTCGILGGEIDVETLVSEQDIAEIFGADNVEVKEQI